MQRIRPTLLVVDDDWSVLKVSSTLLQQFGYDVVTTTDPAEALSLLQQNLPIAGLVTDFRMPVMNGEELAQLAKRIRPDLPVFILSGTNPPERLSAAWDEWFFKGSSFAELVAKIDTVIMRSSSCADMLRQQRSAG
jgi:two-component system, cell cycle response regulator CpdR